MKGHSSLSPSLHLDTRRFPVVCARREETVLTCLLAKTNSKASRSSSSLSIRCTFESQHSSPLELREIPQWRSHSHSSRASVIRSRSLESTTKMIPWVFWKSIPGQSMRYDCEVLSGQRKYPQCLHRGRILSCPPTSQTVNEIFLYSTVSTLKPDECLSVLVLSLSI